MTQSMHKNTQWQNNERTEVKCVLRFLDAKLDKPKDVNSDRRWSLFRWRSTPRKSSDAGFRTTFPALSVYALRIR